MSKMGRPRITPLGARCWQQAEALACPKVDECPKSNCVAFRRQTPLAALVLGNALSRRSREDDAVTLTPEEVRTAQKLTHYFLVLKRIELFGGVEAERVEALDKKLRGER